MLNFFFNLDVRTLMMVLLMGNLASTALICAYYYVSEHGRDWVNCRTLILAKLAQAAAYLLLLCRGTLPPALSVNLGNTLLFFGFYYEASAMLRLIQETRRAKRYLTIVLGICVAGFNLIEFVVPNSSIRVAVASLCGIMIYFMPCYRLFVSEKTTPFKRLVGIGYAVLIVMLVPRTVYAFTTEMSVLTNSIIQTMTFMAMVLLLIFGFPAYLLLMKEHADRTIATLAVTDSLTSLPNRYSFLGSAQRVFSRCKRNGGSIAILFMDVDYFKNVNDGYGHAFGDRVLVALAGVIRDGLRPTDLACRYGGDEFVVLLHDMDVSGAVMIAERIRNGISQLEFSEYPEFRFHISVGVYDGTPEEGDSLDLYIGRADSALFMAKRAGKDRVVEYDPVGAFVSDIRTE